MKTKTPKIRVSWYVGRLTWWQDYPVTDEGRATSAAKIRDLTIHGFHTLSDAGVETYYPSHRVSKVTRRSLK